MEIKRSRGRPRGRPNGMRLTPNWQPKTWKPIYETICTLHVLGVKNTKIAKELKLSIMQVQNILACDKAKERISDLVKEHQASLLLKRENKITEIVDSSIANIHSVVTDKQLAASRPMAMLDASLKALKAFDNTGAVKNDDDKSPINQTNLQFNVFATNPEYAGRIVSGLDKVMEISKRVSGQ